MHFVGIFAWKMGGSVAWNMKFGAAAVVFAIVLAAASLWSFYKVRGHRWLACVLLMGAIASVHLIGLEALTVRSSGVAKSRIQYG